MGVQDIISLITNNGIGVACLLYFMWFNSTTLEKITTALNSINTRLTVIEDRIGIEVGDTSE